ncbi:hypothetical protein MXS87_03350 [Escherichia coli]|nr:hypothetical protein [Escherichia coli]
MSHKLINITLFVTQL